MLEYVNLDQKLTKAEYKAQLPRLQNRLHRLQRACRENGQGILILFEGWDTAGKGTSISKLTERLEPRGFVVHATRAPRTFELAMPWLWRFWQRLPSYGEMAIFDRSWYGRVLVERMDGIVKKRQVRQALRDIIRFERALEEDGYGLTKLFLHIGRKEQKKRLKAIENDPAMSWKVEEEDWKNHDRWDDWLAAYEETLAQTDTEWSRWTIVEATDKRWARVKVFEAVIRSLERALTTRGVELPAEEEAD